MNPEKTTEITAIDYYGDSFQDAGFSKLNKNLSTGPHGYVEIYEKDELTDNKKLVGKSNLVIYQGREWLLSKAFDVQNGNITADKDEFLCWVGLGTGGCPGGDPLDPSPPTNIDTDLDTACGISETDTACADFHTPWYYKHPFDSITFTQDPDNGNYWLLMTIAITISADDANGFNLSEAGLFTALSNAGGYAGPFNMFARITFPTIVKSASRQLIFAWYLYF
jgi:hypothetical protein